MINVRNTLVSAGAGVLDIVLEDQDIAAVVADPKSSRAKESGRWTAWARLGLLGLGAALGLGTFRLGPVGVEEGSTLFYSELPLAEKTIRNLFTEFSTKGMSGSTNVGTLILRQRGSPGVAQQFGEEVASVF